MKHTLTIIALLCGVSASLAQEAATPEAVAEAASAPEAAASAPVEEPTAAPVDVVTREGYVYKMQECGDNNAGAGTRLGNILSMSFLQISKKTGLDMLAGSVAADVAGNVAGNAVEGDTDKRKVCVTVSFKDGTPDQATALPGRTFDALKLRYRQVVAVRFEDGKPVFPW